MLLRTTVGKFVLAIVMLCGSAAVECASAGTYNVNFFVGSTSVTGTIETNCDSCNLLPANVISWSLSYDSTLISSSSGGTYSGNSSILSTLYAGSGEIYFSPVNASSVFFDSSQAELILGGGPTLPIFVLYTAGFQFLDQTINPPQTVIAELASATPLPAALPLFATSLGGLGLLGWRRKRRAVTAV